MHSLQQLLELQFVQYSKRLLINSLELSGELTKESFMLTELVLKYCIRKLMEANATFKFDLFLLCVLLLSTKLAHRLLPSNDQVEVGAIRMASLIHSSSEEICTELIFFRFFLRFNKFLQLLYKHHGVSLIVHLTNELFPCRFF